MNEISLDTPARWKTCVSTIKCDAIGDYIAIMVTNDWTSSCTWYKQFKDPLPGSPKDKPDKMTRRKIELCQGPLCSYVIDYRNKLINEEREEASS
jgi:hypothetical protein